LKAFDYEVGPVIVC